LTVTPLLVLTEPLTSRTPAATVVPPVKVLPVPVMFQVPAPRFSIPWALAPSWMKPLMLPVPAPPR